MSRRLSMFPAFDCWDNEKRMYLSTKELKQLSHEENELITKIIELFRIGAITCREERAHFPSTPQNIITNKNKKDGNKNLDHRVFEYNIMDYSEETKSFIDRNKLNRNDGIVAVGEFLAAKACCIAHSNATFNKKNNILSFSLSRPSAHVLVKVNQSMNMISRGAGD